MGPDGYDYAYKAAFFELKEQKEMADKYYTIRGEAFYAKILGRPVPNYNRDGYEWTIELKPDAEGKKVLKDLKVVDRVAKGEDGDRILFRQRELQSDGVTKNKAISVFDAENQPWPENKLIGNGSVVDLKFKYADYGKGKKAGLYPQGVRVLKHIPYVRQEFAPLDATDEFYREAHDFSEPEDLAPDFNADFDMPVDDLNDEVV